MYKTDKLNGRDVDGVKISTDLVELLKMTQDEENEYLRANLDAVAEIAFYLAAGDQTLDEEQSKKIRFSLIKDLSSVRDILKKLGKAVMISALALLEPELLSNLYDFGDIYLY